MDLSQQPRELVVLVLKDVVYRHLELRSLEDFLVAKYGFKKIEEKQHKISELKHVISMERKEVVFEKEIKRKLSSLKVYGGNYLDAEVKVYILGEVTQKEDVVAGAGGEGQYPIYTAEYQMIKLVSKSGYAIQQLIELLTIDLGLEIKSKEWVFHRCEEG